MLGETASGGIRRRAALAASAFAALGALAGDAALAVDPGRGEAFDAAHWRRAFARPDHVPAPVTNPTTPEKVALGAKLFEETRLSGGGDVACSSCHQPELSFSDGVARRTGLDGETLGRRTPPLWNLAWGLSFFWDGRAASLEAQASMPIENAREMGGSLAKASLALASDQKAAQAFAAAFPDEPAISPANIANALAAYLRTLVSPETRFDAWVEGDDAALAADEMAGLKLFVGKAGCVACHSGWRFSDEAFHDIGLPGADRGRGKTISLAAADHAFKTPSLRERVWSAPYMHDGSLATLEEVVDHYAGPVPDRPTLSADLPRGLALSPDERAQLVAFVGTLSSDNPPRPASLPPKTIALGRAPAGVPVATVGQKGRRFSVPAVALRTGQTLTFVNDDTRTHNIRVDGPGLALNSQAQEPGDKVVVSFETAGAFAAICGIHPEMRLDITVAEH